MNEQDRALHKYQQGRISTLELIQELMRREDARQATLELAVMAVALHFCKRHRRHPVGVSPWHAISEGREQESVILVHFKRWWIALGWNSAEHQIAFAATWQNYAASVVGLTIDQLRSNLEKVVPDATL